MADTADPPGCSLREAVAALASPTVGTASNGCVRNVLVGRGPDVIRFSSTIIPGQIILNSLISTDRDYTLQGPGRDLLELNGLGQTGLLRAQGELTVADVTLRNGNDIGAGAVSASVLNLINARIINSQSESGTGGAAAMTAYVENTEFIGNSSLTPDGGALRVEDLTMIDSFFENNTGGDATILVTSAATISGTMFHANAGGNYGAIHALGANVAVSDSAFIDNGGQATSTLAVSDQPNRVGRGTIRQSYISNDGSLGAANYALSVDGDGSELIIENTTVSGVRGISNWSDGKLELVDSTVYLEGVATAPALNLTNRSVTRVERSIVFSTDGPDCIDGGTQFTENRNNIYGDGDCTANQDGVIFADPFLGALQDNGGDTLSRLPGTGSPAIDAGGIFCAAVDQRGFNRVGLCDIGAIEAGANDALFANGFE
ncbi:MAG: choice-of-anchor Q domain-containing protein [Pseudomonadota bacterium]